MNAFDYKASSVVFVKEKKVKRQKSIKSTPSFVLLVRFFLFINYLSSKRKKERKDQLVTVEPRTAISQKYSLHQTILL